MEEYQTAILGEALSYPDKMTKWVFIVGVALGAATPLAMWRLVDLIRWAFH